MAKVLIYLWSLWQNRSWIVQTYAYFAEKTVPYYAWDKLQICWGGNLWLFQTIRRAEPEQNTAKVYFCSHLINYKTTNVRFAVWRILFSNRIYRNSRFLCWQIQACMLCCKSLSGYPATMQLWCILHERRDGARNFAFWQDQLKTSIHGMQSPTLSGGRITILLREARPLLDWYMGSNQTLTDWRRTLMWKTQ